MRSVGPVSVHPFNRLEFTCKSCGVVGRVDYEYGVWPVIGQEREYRHCPGDQVRQLPGPIVAVWEKRGDRWVLAANRETVEELAAAK